MIENEEIPEAKAIPIPPNPTPVALYGNQDAMDDFPVLKAFQQYVDSEQAKAHKRLMTVCAFFTILIFFIIGVFIFVVMNIRSNQNMPNPAADLQRQLMEQTSRMNEQLIEQLTAKQNVQPPSPAASVVVVSDNGKDKALDGSHSAKERELAEREAKLKKRELENEKRELEEREKAIQEREENLKRDEEAKSARKEEDDAKKKREKEVLEHRRRLYPEYFDENGNEHATPVARKAPEKDPRDAEIERLRKENEIARLKAELEKVKREKERIEKAKPMPKNEDADIDELDKLLESSGVYGGQKKSDPLPDVLNINIGGGDWSIPLE
ncbi:MAG: hypothetical protein IKL02_09055 [Kiritimatiellae bacterium]|nr:hypothetical protein [Kiritimatiellia bacterium]